MKTKHVKNTGQMVRRGGVIGKITRGGRGQTGQIAKGGAKGAKNYIRWSIAP